MKAKSIFVTLVAATIGGLFSIYVYVNFVQNYMSSSFQNETEAQLQRGMHVDSGNFHAQFASMNNANMFNANMDFVEAADASVNAVVHVKTQYKKVAYNPLYDFFFGQGGYQEYKTPVMPTGSGVIVSKDGYIVTNNHVIDRSDYIEIVLNDKRSYPAKLVGRDSKTDLALIKIEGENLPFISYGNSDNLKLGEWVLAVGNPFNLTSTVTAGIVSAKARNINILSDKYAIESFIQTDAAVNPGNSGGALVNTRGELVGINTAIASNTGSFTGYSFAVPVNIVKKVVGDLIEYGKVQRAYMGISIVNIDAKVAQKLNFDKIEGVYISGVNPNGAAFKAGIQEGDVILAIKGVEVNNIPQLQEQMSSFRPSDSGSITIRRNDKVKDIKVVFE